MLSNEFSVETMISEFVQRNYSPRLRYCVCLLVLISQGIGQIIASSWYNNQHLLLCFITQSFIAFLAAFTIQVMVSNLFLWAYTSKACIFDEFNVLETYQPRARTMGHLFMPEPPTPVPDTQQHQENTMNETERSAFLQMRDAHYENEYTYLVKLNRELREGGNLAKQSENKIQNDMSNTPKIEGPVLIEFHADSEKDDDDYSLE
ncbi:NB-ARC domain protein [Dirofilaria immitis]|nr:NB-ARC domain protein [Dirofilaria immitis]